MFEIHDKVFYPRRGVGTVVNIASLENDRRAYIAYIISLKDLNYGHISLPIDEAENLGLRRLVSEEKIEQALNILSSTDEDSAGIYEHWKGRRKELEQMFVEGDVCTFALLIKVFYHKHQYKPLGSGERKLYDDALKFLTDELSEVKNIDLITSGHLIAKSLMLSLSS